MEVPELLEVPLPGALVLPLLVEPEVVPVVLLPGALVLPLVVPAVLLVVPDDLFDVPLLTGAVSLHCWKKIHLPPCPVHWSLPPAPSYDR